MNKIVYLKFMTTLYQKDKSNDKAFEWDEYKKQKLLFELGGGNLKQTKNKFFQYPSMLQLKIFTSMALMFREPIQLLHLLQQLFRHIKSQ